MIMERDLKLDFKDILFKPMRSTLSSRKQVELTRKFVFNNKAYEFIPIVSSNMDTVGTFEMANELMKYNMLTCIHKHYPIDKWNEFIHYHKQNETLEDMKRLVIPSIGIKEKELELYKQIQHEFDFLCVDVANGYSSYFSDYIRKLKDMFPEKIIIAGNVVSGEMTSELILAGASIVKVGIGGGSACTTRLKTGVGISQVSAIIDCANVAHGLGGHIMSDGGCVYPGDISKAFGCGADFIMLGGMFAGVKESSGEIIIELHYSHHDENMNPVYEPRQFKRFYGMSSKTANDKYSGGLKEYRTSEGRDVKVPYKGELKNVVQDILGGVSSTMTYIGARKLKDIPKCATFVNVTQVVNNPYDNTTS